MIQFTPYVMATEQQLRQIALWRNELKRYFRQAKNLTIKDQKQFQLYLKTSDKDKFWIISNEYELIGACGLTDINETTAEISLFIGIVYIDDYYANAALQYLCDQAFNKLKLSQVTCFIYEFDKDKEKLLKDFGFAFFYDMFYKKQNKNIFSRNYVMTAKHWRLKNDDTRNS